jgi:hypothetical protein
MHLVNDKCFKHFLKLVSQPCNDRMMGLYMVLEGI